MNSFEIPEKLKIIYNHYLNQIKKYMKQKYYIKKFSEFPKQNRKNKIFRIFLEKKIC